MIHLAACKSQSQMRKLHAETLLKAYLFFVNALNTKKHFFTNPIFKALRNVLFEFMLVSYGFEKYFFSGTLYIFSVFCFFTLMSVAPHDFDLEDNILKI